LFKSVKINIYRKLYMCSTVYH